MYADPGPGWEKKLVRKQIGPIEEMIEESYRKETKEGIKSSLREVRGSNRATVQLRDGKLSSPPC